MPEIIGTIASFLAANSGAISAGAALAGTGIEAASALSGGSKPPAVAAAASPQQQMNQRSQVAAAIARQFPNLQSLVGDSLSPTYLEKQASVAAGLPGEGNAAQDAWTQYMGQLGLGSPGLTGGL